MQQYTQDFLSDSFNNTWQLITLRRNEDFHLVQRNNDEMQLFTLPLPEHCKDNSIYVFLFWELRGLSPNFHIHVSVRDLYIPRIGPHISLQQNR